MAAPRDRPANTTGWMIPPLPPSRRDRGDRASEMTRVEGGSHGGGGDGGPSQYLLPVFGPDSTRQKMISGRDWYPDAAMEATWWVAQREEGEEKEGRGCRGGSSTLLHGSRRRTSNRD
ncbi:hypothetical protein GGTG_09522 [Gaeumannomyces tritici R3-111a-1]|uniref:Uncharacterized protein n=1 Tax=Gaeumannomyces tritici (strain R3-111a-1) TaxID=644352 RepID=J3P7N1_GAET3|nr:hypothetical protein GGTG_09522 [Gaeumannomyces tritici R3-111a-1]EJT72663.1 hypothetical protein GGTG_09522 [Gaeumannomyces tritici R3-111a-1]